MPTHDTWLKIEMESLMILDANIFFVDNNNVPSWIEKHVRNDKLILQWHNLQCK